MEINQQGKWLSVLDYAQYKKISISSVRRRIKASRVQHKLENGKYLIWVKNYQVEGIKDTEQIAKAYKQEIQKLKEENQELKMLVGLYEKQLGKGQKDDVPPEIPFS